MIEKRLRAAADYVAKLGYSPAYVSLHGSQNYGLDIHTDDYQSDYDFKCIVLPSLWDLVEGKKPVSLTVNTEDGQIDIKDIRVLIDVLERMNPAYLESLTTQHHLSLEPEMDDIRAQLPALMKQQGGVFARACAGLFEGKARRLCHDCPAAHEKIGKHGYDGKQAHHMYRLLVQLREFEGSGELRLCVPQEEREVLIRLKRNEIPLDDALSMIEGWRKELNEAVGRIEEKYAATKTAAYEEIVRIARSMMHAHCLKP